jgi:hypothetical protein
MGFGDRLGRGFEVDAQLHARPQRLGQGLQEPPDLGPALDAGALAQELVPALGQGGAPQVGAGLVLQGAS